MRNYSEILLHEELSSSQREVLHASTRLEAILGFFADEIMPAITGITETRNNRSDAILTRERSESEIITRRQFRGFGQVLPIEDIERVIDIADSITRMPCGCRFMSKGLKDQRYCFGFGVDRWGILGNFPDAAASLETVSKREAKTLFRGYDTEGLIHTIWTDGTPYILGL